MIDGRKQHRQLAILVHRAQEGDRTAFEELYAITAQAQYFTIIGKVGVDAAADLLQELYLVVWRNIGSIHPDALISYLNTTTRNLCLRHLNRRSTSQMPLPTSDEFLEDAGDNRKALFDTTATDDPAIAIADQDQQARLTMALYEALDDQEREAVLLRFYQGLKLNEVAETMGISRATVKRVLARSLDKLRSRLGMLPMGAALSQAMASAVEAVAAPGATLRGTGSGKRSFSTSAGERAGAVVAIAAAVVLALVGFMTTMPQPETIIEDMPPAAEFPRNETAVADAQGPRLLEATVEGDVTVLHVGDATGTAQVTCANESGTLFEPEATTPNIGIASATEGAPSATSRNADEPNFPPLIISEWRFNLPAGTYELRAADVLGNTSTGTVTVNLPADPFSALTTDKLGRIPSQA
ncbi:sigma-70 family RNA polymerase sigma factor [Adlercreutzia sp. R21]|uniref:RNA polymerase sigma factor n=1 Tax=Adlercreutzia wanghongyangiae TaxID=3111451 RepID=UPI002DB83BA9|nr:sigma-70 family RNA polymerase sigma factor [Adlercreutzia sp. R21]MEC4185311.1 sigma-70 family RNA polymerase sigma factor [Adlercreutzia sp. R21]